jgi:phage portal protein BeeE
VSFVDRILPWRRKSMSTLDLFREIYGGKVTGTGKTITLQKALEVSTVVACMRVISEGVAQIPLKLMLEAGGQRLPNTRSTIFWRRSRTGTRPRSSIARP